MANENADLKTAQEEIERLQQEIADRDAERARIDEEMAKLRANADKAQNRESAGPEVDDLLGSIAVSGVNLQSLSDLQQLQIARDNLKAQTLNLDVAPDGGRFLDTNGNLIDVDGKLVDAK